MKKRKWLAGILILAMLFSLAGGGALLAFAEEKEPVVVKDVNFSPDGGGWGACVFVNLTDDSNHYPHQGNDSAEVTANFMSHISYVNRKGENLLKSAETFGSNLSLSRGSATCNVGDMVTLKAGLEWVGKELKEDVSYVCNAEGQPWVVFAPTVVEAPNATESIVKGGKLQITFTAKNDTVTYNNAPATYAIADESIATVTGDGLTATVTGVEVGKTTLTATCGGKTASVEITVEEALEVDTIAVAGKVSVYTKDALTEADLAGLTGTKTYKAAEGETPKTSAFDVELSMLTAEDYDLTKPATYPVTVTVEGKTAQFNLEVKAVPAPTMGYMATGSGASGWGEQHSIHFATPNSGSMDGNSGDEVASQKANITVNGTAYSEILAVRATTDLYNYVLFKHTPQPGEIVVAKAGLKLYNNAASVFAVTQEDYTFVYNGSAWVRRVDATGMAFAATKNRLAIGEKLDLGTYFTPKDENTVGYTDKPITYESSDTAIATVSAAGEVTAVAPGDATITAKCEGLEDATYAVKVMINAVVTGITIKEHGAQTIYLGQDYTLPTVVKNVKYGEEAPVEEPVTITAENITGTFDKNTAGTYTLTVTAEEKTATFTVEVKELEEVKVQNVNYDSAGWNMILIATDTDCGVGQPWGDADAAHIVVKNAIGEVIPLADGSVVELGKYIHIVLTNPEVGTIVTVQKGYRFAPFAEFKEEVSYIYAEANKPFEVYDPEKHDVKTFAIKNSAEENTIHVYEVLPIVWEADAPTTPHFTSSDSAVATVDAQGNVEGIAEGEAVITAKAGAKTATYTVKVSAALPIKTLRLATQYKIWVEKDATVTLPADFTVQLVFDNNGAEVLGRPFALTAENSTFTPCATDTAGTFEADLTVTYREESYEFKLPVEVFEVVDMALKEVAIVEWFGFNVFVQFPNSSANGTNMTTLADIPDATKFTYTRVDGTEVPCGAYNLGGGNIAILPTFIDADVKLENFNQAPYYQEGDKITLLKGLTGYCWTGEADSNTAGPVPGTGMLIRECVLAEEVSYVFDGTGWFEFVAYTDMEAPETVTVVLGETVSLRAFRVPDNANEGVFTYTVADETVAKMASNGRITGLKLDSTTTVTVTLSGGAAGEKTKTITVNVVDGIKELSLGENARIEVKQGTEMPDLSGLSAQLVYASGKTEAADLSNAEIIGYNKDALGETEVTVRITVNGETYQAQLIVNVVDAGCGCGGCGSGMTGYASIVLAAGALAVALAAVLLGKRRKSAK